MIAVTEMAFMVIAMAIFDRSHMNGITQNVEQFISVAIVQKIRSFQFQLPSVADVDIRIIVIAVN